MTRFLLHSGFFIIIPFELKKVFIQEGAGPAGTFTETIHYTQKAVMHSGKFYGTNEDTPQQWVTAT